jgi:hypothetical protein
MAARSLFEKDIPDATVYGPKPMSNNLLRTSSPLLGSATGRVAGSPARVQMHFVIASDNSSGDMMIAPPPILYEKEDLGFMFGIIAHELRHAADFVAVDGSREPFYNANAAEFDMDAYATNVMEARAFADQVAETLRLMGGRTDLVIEAMDRSNLMLMAPNDVKEVMKIMLEEIASRNLAESAPPAAVKDEKKHADQIVELLLQIVERFRLARNFKGRTQ